jgi:hypothetical protein
MLANFRFPRRSLATALLLTGLALQTSAVLADQDDHDDDARDPVVLSFSTVGDSRQDPVNPDATTLPVSGQDAKWLQNTKAWSRIIRSVENQRSDFLFFNGDMIMGYGNAVAPTDATVPGVLKSDLMAFYKQYGFWRGMVADLMETGTYVVPVPGNHEVQCKKCGPGGSKAAQEVNENAWRDNMGDLILDTSRLSTMFPDWASASYYDADNHPQVGGLDPVGTEQNQLSYSFDFRGTHFVVMNTDAVGYDGHAPVNWLADDLAAAKARGAEHFFVFGHKPAYSYHYEGSDPKASGFDADPVNQKAFWDLMEQDGGTYFCGHEHIFNMTQPRAGTGGKAWQVLVGSGGSPFESSVATSVPSDRMYAWATVKVRQSGKVEIRAYGFDDQYGPTKLIQKAKLPH